MYSHGYTGGSDSHPNGPLNTNQHSGPITDQNSGTHFSNGRGPSSSKLGSDSFLNRPVHSNVGQSGKTTGPSSENGKPSILATRKPNFNGSGPGKLTDGSTTHPHINSHGSHSPTTDVSSSNGRPLHRHGSGPNSPSNENANTGSADNVSHGRNQPIRSGDYGTSQNGHGGHGHSDNGKTPTGNGNGLQPYDQTRNRTPSFGKDTSNAFDQIHGRTPANIDSSGNGGTQTGPQTTDVLSGFRNVFKLPPGLCLVKCDSLKPGQALTSDQIRDAFISSGLNGKHSL